MAYARPPATRPVGRRRQGAAAQDLHGGVVSVLVSTPCVLRWIRGLVSGESEVVEARAYVVHQLRADPLAEVRPAAPPLVEVER